MRKRTGIIILVMVVVLALGAFVVWQNLSANRANAAATVRTTGTLTRGELAASVSGAERCWPLFPNHRQLPHGF